MIGFSKTETTDEFSGSEFGNVFVFLFLGTEGVDRVHNE